MGVTETRGDLNCVDCHRPMRTKNGPRVEGVTIVGAFGKCAACYQRDRRHPPLTPVEPGRTQCERCGCPSSRVLCRDCRDVMSKEEVAAWAA